MRTTLELPDVLFKQAKALAAEKGLSLKAFVTSALEQALREPQPGERRMVRPPIAGRADGEIPALSNAELAALLEAEELQKA